MARNLTRRGNVWTFRKEIDGKEYRVSTRCRDRKLAEKVALQIDRDIQLGRFGLNLPPTFGRFAADYLVAVVSPRKKRGCRDLQIIGHVLPDWEERRLDTIKRQDCEVFLFRRQQEGASAGTINRERGLLRAMFNMAKMDRLIESNPFDGVKRLPVEQRDRVLGLEEQHDLVDQLNPSCRRLVTVLIGTGLRLGELQGLRPCDIDGDCLRIRASTSKGFKARRVPLLESVRAALDEQREATACGKREQLWPQTAWAIRKAIKGAARRAGIENLCVHDLRRTFATRCATAGMPMPQLAAILGHASTLVTSQYYVHVQTADNLWALKKVAARWEDESGTKVVTLRRAFQLSAGWRRG